MSVRSSWLLCSDSFLVSISSTSYQGGVLVSPMIILHLSISPSFLIHLCFLCFKTLRKMHVYIHHFCFSSFISEVPVFSLLSFSFP